MSESIKIQEQLTKTQENLNDRLWDALADMLHNGALAIEQFLGRAKPALTVIRGSAA